MNFELLPNEILLDLFDYFDSTELFWTFYGLNSRIYLLIRHQSRYYNFNFRWVSKRSFDMICQKYLPVIADRVIALHLTDSYYTPNQINFFFSYISSLSKFPQLQFLSVSDVGSYQTLLKIINECYHLCNLTHLNLHSSWLLNNQAHFQSIVDETWSLPRLIHCYFHINMNDERQLFCVPTKISLSLESIVIIGSQLEWDQVNQLFRYTPRLKHLSIGVKHNDHHAYHPSFFSGLTDFRMINSNESNISKLSVFLKQTPNLYRLDINIDVLIDGYQWEQIIRNCLPKLKIFQLNITCSVFKEQNIQKQVDKLVDSFRSPFWIDEHRWFIRCYAGENTIYLSTLSKIINYLRDTSVNLVKSTCPHDTDEQQFYKTDIYITNEKFFDQPILSNFQTGNITSLNIELPINNQFWSSVSSLTRLRFLVVSSYADTFQSQLQALFDRTSVLDMLLFRQNKTLPIPRSLFKYTNVFVRRLHLQCLSPHFNEEECMALTRSSLSARCELLSIGVTNRESIIWLVENMIYLRFLDVELDRDVYGEHLSQNRNNNETASRKDELVLSLKDRLPPTCYITRSPLTSRNILIWI